MEPILVTRGMPYPFVPLQPAKGRRLTKAAVEQIDALVEARVWIVQPVLAGTRAVLAVHQGVAFVYAAGRRNITRAVRNAAVYRKLGDGCCLDGQVYDNRFHPFECLAFQKRSLLNTTTDERVVMAYTLVRLVGEPWMFKRPTARFMLKMARNEPQWTGVILKKDRMIYSLASQPGAVNTDWIVRPWFCRSRDHEHERVHRAHAGVES